MFDCVFVLIFGVNVLNEVETEPFGTNVDVLACLFGWEAAVCVNDEVSGGGAGASMKRWVACELSCISIDRLLYECVVIRYKRNWNIYTQAFFVCSLIAV